ncbi:MAG: glycosyltransferase family 39 protein [Candidatus Omnitrophota bacterium]|nr:glycosyltransferase family 39 protein [Candidatus Omnitrophota bacterium]
MCSMARGDGRAILFIIVIAIFIAASFAFIFKKSWQPETDAVQYDAIGWNIASGHGFSMDNSEPYVPTMLREPVYPFFLAGIYRIFGHNLMAVVLAQIALFVITCVMTYILARGIFNEKVAIYSGVLCALSPALANYPGYLLSETLFTFLLCATVFCANRAAASQRWVWFFISGAALAVTVLCKSIMVLFFFPALAGIILFRRPADPDVPRKLVMRITVFSIAFILLVGSWSYRNHSLFGTYQISLRGGTALWEKAGRMSKPWHDIKKEAVFNFSEYLGAKLFPGTAEDPRNVILEWSAKAYYKDLELKKMGLSSLEADRAMGKEALGKIYAEPLKFLAYVPIEMIKMTSFMYVPVLNEARVIAWFHRMDHGDAVLSGIRGVFRLCAYPILILAIIGIFAQARAVKKLYFILVAIIYVNLIYSMLFAMGRYAVPLVPFYSILASAGFLAVVNRLRRAA